MCKVSEKYITKCFVTYQHSKNHKIINQSQNICQNTCHQNNTKYFMKMSLTNCFNKKISYITQYILIYFSI